MLESEVVGSGLELSMSLLPSWFEQLRVGKCV